jgi:PAS domain S-box-containing protein
LAEPHPNAQPSLFDTFEEGVARFDPEARLSYVNPALLRRFRRPLDQVLGHSLWDLYPEALEDQLSNSLRRVLATGRGERIEHQFGPWDAWFDSRLHATVDGVYLIATEVAPPKPVTSRPLPPSVSQEEYERLVSLFEQSPAAIGVVSAPDWVWQFSNARNDELAGRGPLVGRNVFEAMPELVSQGFAHLLDLIYRTGETFDDFEVKLQVTTGQQPREMWLNGTYQPIRNPDGKIDRIATFVHDVTEKVKARHRIEALAEELKASEARARRLQDSGVIGVVFFTRDGQIVDANEAFLSMLGYSREELVAGLSWKDMTPPEYAELDERAFREMETKGICTPFEKAYVAKDGRLVPILIGVAFWEGSTDSGVAWIVDISARRAAEAERDSLLERERLARAQAEQANRSKDEFLAMVSHELRTPLNAMLGWARMLASGTLDQARQKRGLEVIERNAIAQAQLIEDLLDVSRIVHGKLRLEVASMDFRAVVEAAVDSVRPSVEHKGVALSATLEPELDPIVGDAHRLQQVVWNLLSNAAKFTPKGGHVQVQLRKSGEHVELVVADDGRGISEAALPYVFERFRQADASITRAFGGLGLGLSIAKHLAELHGGSITAESPGEGAGSRFTLRLGNAPLPAEGSQRPPAPPRSRGAINEIPPELAGLRILVVDDEPDARELASTILCQGGATILPASSAEHALRLLAEQPIDVILSDIGMPELDGYELIRRVRQLPTPAGRIPAAALTAFARTDERRQAMLAGFQLHISKPVEPTELTAAVACLARIGRVGN